MSIITCIAVAIVAGFIVFFKTLNAKKYTIHSQSIDERIKIPVKNLEKENYDRNAQMPKEPETWIDEFGVVFSADKKKLIKAPIGLKEYIIPEDTISIEARAFISSQIECVIIPNSVTRIKFGAFAWCYKLVAEIPNSVVKNGNEAFLLVKEVHCYGPLKEKGPWGAKKFITEKPKKIDEKEDKDLNKSGTNSDSHVGEIPWGHSDAHNGYSHYYKGEIRNGVPHGYGGVYEIDMVTYGGRSFDRLLYSGRWENGVFMDEKRRIDELTDEEWRAIN